MNTGKAEGLSTVLTKHAAERMHARRVPTSWVLTVLSFGREVHLRGAVIYAIGRNEVEKAKLQGIDLRRHEGLHVVCSREGTILTVYRNRALDDLRPRRGKNYRRLPRQIAREQQMSVSLPEAA